MLNLLTMPNILSIILPEGDGMKASSTEVLTYICQADADQLSEIIQAIVQRYGQINPNWEVSFLSFPKNDLVQQKQILQSILQLYDRLL